MTDTKKKIIKKDMTIKTPKKDMPKKVVIKKAVEHKTTENLSTEKDVKKVTVKKEATKKVSKNTNSTYATGKRKNAIAKLWLKQGTGKIVINGKPAAEYLKRAILSVIIDQPFARTETSNKFDIECQVLGGGLSGQAGAVKHAISKALQEFNPELRSTLKSAGFLTRDSRVVERKKAGLKKARKGQVFQKR